MTRNTAETVATLCQKAADMYPGKSLFTVREFAHISGLNEKTIYRRDRRAKYMTVAEYAKLFER